MVNKLRLEIRSRTGRFNLCSDEQSVSCHIAVYENDNQTLSTNLTLEYEENPSIAYADDAIYLLEECFKKMWIDTSRDEKKVLLKFIKKHKKELDYGSVQHRIKVLKNEIKTRRNEIKSLSNLA